MAVANEFAGWSEPVRAMLVAHGWRGAFAVVFPTYRPDLVHALAYDLGLAHFDFRAEVMAPLGWEANKLDLDDLNRELRARAQETGVVAHNVEALLATKSESARGAWLSKFLDRDHPAPVVVPVVLYAGALPSGNDRTHVLTEERLPEQSLLSRFVY